MMGTDKRLSRGERSGRYVPDYMRDDMDWNERRIRYLERAYDRRRADDRHRDRLDDCRDSPGMSRKRRHCDSSDDEYDGDRPDQGHKTLPSERNKPIVLEGLPPNITEEEIRAALEQLQGPQPAGIVVSGKRTGKTQDCAVMEFYHMQDSARWMETNQKKLEIQGRYISVEYSHKRAMYENWLCNLCGLCNFKRRPRCLQCGVDGGSPAVDGINVEPQQESDGNSDTLIMRNLAPISSVDGILNMLSPYANVPASKVYLLNHKQTGNNKVLGFVQLSSPLEASQLLTILQSLQPPLKLDGKTVAVDYAKTTTRNGAQHCGKRATHISVASTAITGAHWSSSQLQPGSDATSDYVAPPEGFSQQSQEQNYQVWQQQHLKGLSLVNGDGFPGAAPGTKTSLPAATGVVISQTAQIYQPVVFSQTAIQSHHVARAVDAELQQPHHHHHHQQQQHHQLQHHQLQQPHHHHQQQQHHQLQQPHHHHHHHQQQQQQQHQEQHQLQQHHQLQQPHHHHHQQQQHHQLQQPHHHHHHHQQQQQQQHQEQHQLQQHHQRQHQEQQHQEQHQKQQHQEQQHHQHQLHHHQHQLHHQLQQPASVSTAPPVTPAASSVSTTVSAPPTIKTSAVPDMSTFQFDKDSGYYYDPQTRLYYDPSSQYYYNSGTQQYLYWDGEKQTYVQATEDMMAEQSSSSEEPKIKKKPKTRSSQQISENMERWIKRLNKRNGSSKRSVQDLGPSKEEDKKCSAAADAGFSLSVEKQSRDFETPSLMNEQFKILEQETKSDPFVSYNGNNEPEEGGLDGSADEEGRITDWRTGVCVLCRRQFPTIGALLRHQQLSVLHKQNLEIQRRSSISVADKGRRDSELMYRDRAAERRGRCGASTANKEFQPPANYGKPTNNGLTSNKIRKHKFQVTGWHKYSDLGYHQ